MKTVMQCEGWVYVAAIGFSLLLSCWLGLRETVINPDGICYLLSAQQMSQGGLSAVMQTCGQASWPFFSVLLYGVAHLTQGSYLASAYVLDGCFTLLSIVTFIAIVKECGGRGRVLWLAAAVVLLSHEFNSVRQYIVRDHGFWAFYLLSIFSLLRYVRDLRWINAVAWSVSLGMATLFRIEGSIFLLVLPWLAWLLPQASWKQRSGAFLAMNAVSILAAVVIGSWLLLHPEQTLAQLGRLHEISDRLLGMTSAIAERYQSSKAAFAHSLLVPESMRDAGLVLSLTLIVWYLVSVITNLSWAYAYCVAYAWWTRAAALSRTTMLVLAAYLLINALVTFTFFAEHLFLAKRYLIAFSLVFMVWVPFGLERLLQQYEQGRQRVLLMVVAMAILISSIGGIVDFGYSKTYIRTAGDWIAQHVPPNEPVYSNSDQVMYYTNHVEEGFYKSSYRYHHLDIATTDDWKHYHYIALRLNQGETNALQGLLENNHWPSVQEFANQRGDRVVIYKMPQ